MVTALALTSLILTAVAQVMVWTREETLNEIRQFAVIVLAILWRWNNDV